MIRLLGLLALVLLAVASAMALELTWGNVTFWVPPYRIDMSLQALLIIVLLFVIAVMVVWQLVLAILGIPASVRQFRKRRIQEQRLLTLSELIVEFFEGRFARAIKASRLLKHDRDLLRDVPLAVTAADAIAASAAHQMRDPQLRDQLIDELRTHPIKESSEVKTLAALLEAEFAVEDRKGARALTALAPLTRGDRRHVHTLRLSLKANQQQGNWDEVLRITRLLENRKALIPVVALQYKKQVVEFWISRARHLEAIALIESVIKDQWDSGMVMLYGRCMGNAKSQTATLEHWLQRHPRDAEVNWALGRLCQRQQLWGKARMHLEASLRIKPMVVTHLALAEIAESLSEKETAAFHWKAAAQLQ